MHEPAFDFEYEYIQGVERIERYRTGDAITVDKAELLLGDFGVAFRLDDTSRFRSCILLELRPPQAFFEPETALTFGSEI
ncbi:hypothetical protein E4U12_003748 [Claviceps purpurea]|nr:hypothetical protein E4U12_003748 [Claviceps purpurea]